MINNNTYGKKPNVAKYLFIFLLLIILTASSVFGAVNIYSNTYDNQRSNNGANPYIDNSENLSNVYDYSLPSLTSEYTHKICDVNNNGVKDVITYNIGDTSFSYVSGYGNEINAPTSVNLPSGYGIKDLICIPKSDNSGNNLIIVMTSSTQTKITEYSLVNDVLSEQYNYMTKTGLNYAPISDVTCGEYQTFGFNFYKCYYVPEVASGLTAIYFSNAGISPTYKEIIVNDGTLRQPATSVGTSYLGTGTDEVGNKKLLETSANGNDIYYFHGSSVIHANYGNCIATTGDECLISTIDTKTINGYATSNMLFSSIQRVSSDATYYCFIETRRTTAVNSAVSGHCLNSDLTIEKVVSDTIASCVNPRQPIKKFSFGSDINNDGAEDFCIGFYNTCIGSASTSSGGYCFDIPSATKIVNDLSNYIITAKSSYAGEPFFIGYDLSSSELDVLSYATGRSNITLSTSLNVTDVKLMIEDISGDGTGELIGVSPSEGLYASFFEPLAPSSITFYQSVYNYYNPSCTNDDIQFKMRECDTLECTYSTSNSRYYPTEQEKICTSCGGTQTYSCGNYSLNNPSIICSNFSAPTTYNIQFDLFTSLNEDFPAGTSNLSLVVSNTNCGLPSNFVVAPVVGGVPGDDDGDGEPDEDVIGDDLNDPETFIDTILETFFHTRSTKLKLIIGAGVIMGMMILVFKKTKGKATNFLYASAGVIGIIINIAIGIFSKEFGFILAVIIVLMGVTLFKKRSNDGVN